MAHRRVHHSTLGWRVKEKGRADGRGARCASSSRWKRRARWRSALCWSTKWLSNFINILSLEG